MSFMILKAFAAFTLALTVSLETAVAQREIPAGTVDFSNTTAANTGTDRPGKDIYRMTCYPCHSSGSDTVPDLVNSSLRDQLRLTGAQTLVAEFFKDNIFHQNMASLYDWSQDNLSTAFQFLLNAEEDQLVEMERFDVVEDVDEKEQEELMAAASQRVPVDLREIDHLPEADFLDDLEFNNVHYKAPSTLTQAVNFYRSQLEAKGWQEVKEDNTKILNIAEIFGFIEDGYYILFQANADPSDLNAVTVLIYNRLY